MPPRLPHPLKPPPSTHLKPNPPSSKRTAHFIPRPRRPYTFTQLLTLSDGSTFTHRTTSPQPLHRSARDTRNAPLWNPSNAALSNVEEDEAGRLKAFRRRFGRGWDARSAGGGGGGDAEGMRGDVPRSRERRTGGEGDPVDDSKGPPAAAQRDAPLGEATRGVWQAVEGRGGRAGEESRVERDRGRETADQAREEEQEEEENLMDLISSYGREAEGEGKLSCVLSFR